MTKKFLALTLVLVLATGFMAVAAEHGDDRPLYGSWENTLTLNPTPPAGSNIIKAFDSTLDVTYESGGITYTSESVFDLTGYADQTFGVSTSMGLLTLDSTVDFDPSVPALSYWATDASLGLGGVNLSTLFLLQDTDSTSSTHYGAGLKFSLSGETPGGVSVAVDNYFGMDVGTGPSGYDIITDHDETQTDSYGASSLQYVSTVLTLDSMSLGCCDFSSETKFSEAEGFEYTLFEFTITSETMPLSLAADLKFTPQTKSIHLTPTLETGWACFDVYTSLDANLSRNTNSGSVIDSLIVKGFSITGVELGHVTFSSYTALGTYTVADLNSSLRGSYTYTYVVGGETEETYTEELDELIRIEKLDKFPLSFTADVYFDMSDSNGLFDLALFELNTAYDLSTQFAVGSGLLISPKNDPYGGLEEVYFSFDYTF